LCSWQLAAASSGSANSSNTSSWWHLTIPHCCCCCRSLVCLQRRLLQVALGAGRGISSNNGRQLLLPNIWRRQLLRVPICGHMLLLLLPCLPLPVLLLLLLPSQLHTVLLLLLPGQVLLPVCRLLQPVHITVLLIRILAPSICLACTLPQWPAVCRLLLLLLLLC
jgi:hypothetical protein